MRTRRYVGSASAMFACGALVFSCDGDDSSPPPGAGAGGVGARDGASQDVSTDVALGGDGGSDAGGDGSLAADADGGKDDADAAPSAPCGNGAADDGEACDDGPLNGKGAGRCLRDCSARCGDGKVEGTETCDEGASNGQAGHCSVGCGFVCGRELPSCPIYVDRDAAPGGDGSSWERAYHELGPALAACRTRPSPIIWIAEGTYGQTLHCTDIEFNLLGSFYGGFSGDESRPADRDWKAHPTIIDGDGVRVAARRVQLLDGLVITRSLGISHLGSFVRGIYTRNRGGIINGSSTVPGIMEGIGIAHSEFHDNEITSGGLVSGVHQANISDSSFSGFGGVDLGFLSSPSLTRVTSRGTSFSASDARRLTVEDSQFIDARVSRSGTGAVTQYDSSIVNSTFVNSDVTFNDSEKPFLIRNSEFGGGRLTFNAGLDGSMRIEDSRFKDAVIATFMSRYTIASSRFVGERTRLFGGSVTLLNSSFVYGSVPILRPTASADWVLQIGSCSFTSSHAIPPWSPGAWSSVVVNSVGWPVPLMPLPSSAAAPSYSCFPGASGATNKVLTASPFVVVTKPDGFDELYLDPQSPCVNAGSASMPSTQLIDPAWQQKTTNTNGCTDRAPLDPGVHYTTQSSTPCN